MNKKKGGAHTKQGSPPPGLVSGRMYLTKMIRPQLSIHFNFMIDLEWLIRQYPVPCRDSPIQCVVGEKMGSDKRSLSKVRT
ncbi:hypothetical protein TELCIR_09217 [Teladorsagia circumcincta]|uniref:Uncharacterized protein n=1 Tax=Teladorsagia circumcincta TaxID=45464 RepID=A0A2G9UFG6_TELCI|nr:hypothetical protein TELCIR_09217 [Teladorsagia circumcincta]